MLLTWGVVALARPNLQILLVSSDFDAAVATIGVEIGRLVGDDVLAAQLFFDSSEGMSDVLHLERKECPATGGFGQLLEILVASEDQAAIVGRDRVDEYSRPLRHLDCLSAGYLALVVFPIAEDHECLANGVIGVLVHQFFAAGTINGVVQSGTTAVLQVLNGARQLRNAVGEVLRELSMRVKSEHEGLVVAGTENVLQKIGCGLLFEIEAAAYRSAYVDQ